MVSRRIIIFGVVIVTILSIGVIYYVSAVTNPKSVTESVTFGLSNIQQASFPAFMPSNLTVTEGEHVTIVFHNYDNQPHELVIPEFNVTTGIVQGGNIARVSFVPNQVGTFPFDQPAGACIPGNLSPGPIACRGVQLFNGTMTVLPSS